MKIHKKKKAVRMRGSRYHGWAAKKHKGKGSRGGIGMAGSGKRGDAKKTLVQEKYGHKYFGKTGITSTSMKIKKDKIIQIRDIEKNLDSLIKKYGKKTGEGYELNFKNYKILGNDKLNAKLILRIKSISKKAKKQIEKAGGKVIIEKNGV